MEVKNAHKNEKSAHGNAHENRGALLMEGMSGEILEELLILYEDSEKHPDDYPGINDSHLRAKNA